MNTYIAFCIQILTFATLVAGSAITLIYLHGKYGFKSSQFVIGVIVCTWVTLVVNVVLSIFGLNTMLDELIAYPHVTSVFITTAYLATLGWLRRHPTITARIIAFSSFLLGRVILYYLYSDIPPEQNDALALFTIVGAIAQLLIQLAAFFLDDDEESPAPAQTNPTPSNAEPTPPAFTHRVIWQRQQPSIENATNPPEPTAISVLTDITTDCLQQVSQVSPNHPSPQTPTK